MTAPTPETEVSLMNMRFHVRVGILPHEREIAQMLEVDLVVRRAVTEQSILDYRDLYEATLGTIRSDPLTYLEPLAEALATRALAFDGVRWCRVAVRKPHAAVGGQLDYAQVAVERTRA